MADPSPLDDVDFLARSPHRVAVLQTLQEGPWARPALHDETGISQPTLGRVLDSLQERGWVERASREYALTPVGGLVVEAFADLLETVGTAQQLGGVAGLLPTERMDFDLRRFDDARIMTPASGDAFNFVSRVEELVYGADHLRLLSTTMPPGSSAEHRERAEDFLASERVVEGVVTADTLARTLADPGSAATLRETLDLDRVDLYRYEGSIPLMAGVADGTALLVPMEAGRPAGLIETTDETVRAWVVDLFEEYRAQSTPLTVDDLSA